MKIELAIGSITEQPDCDAIVNAANPMLRPGGGVAGAIHRDAGHELAKFCEQYAPIAVGEAVITPGFNLPNKQVIHVLGPVYFTDPDAQYHLRKAIRSIMELCEENSIQRIALPAISTGAYGYPIEEAAEIILEELGKWKGSQPTMARVVIFDQTAHFVFRDLLEDE
ncbi:RNase III inhibitor [Polynucleobacter paneuropaeus]|nr:macro domain-containing protein [Polynucleobacter paneuropaeus]MBT8539481.1 RNase III inhibitor [Polynucleobacter paneuropaeus]RAZ47512.1 RNase III inhibitor [Polynucleobacter paneuropaeus]